MPEQFGIDNPAIRAYGRLPEVERRREGFEQYISDSIEDGSIEDLVESVEDDLEMTLDSFDEFMDMLGLIGDDQLLPSATTMRQRLEGVLRGIKDIDTTADLDDPRTLQILTDALATAFEINVYFVQVEDLIRAIELEEMTYEQQLEAAYEEVQEARARYTEEGDKALYSLEQAIYDFNELLAQEEVVLDGFPDMSTYLHEDVYDPARSLIVISEEDAEHGDITMPRTLDTIEMENVVVTTLTDDLLLRTVNGERTGSSLERGENLTLTGVQRIFTINRRDGDPADVMYYEVRRAEGREPLGFVAGIYLQGPAAEVEVEDEQAQDTEPASPTATVEPEPDEEIQPDDPGTPPASVTGPVEVAETPGVGLDNDYPAQRIMPIDLDDYETVADRAVVEPTPEREAVEVTPLETEAAEQSEYEQSRNELLENMNAFSEAISEALRAIESGDLEASTAAIELARSNGAELEMLISDFNLSRNSQTEEAYLEWSGGVTPEDVNLWYSTLWSRHQVQVGRLRQAVRRHNEAVQGADQSSAETEVPRVDDAESPRYMGEDSPFRRRLRERRERGGSEEE